MTLHTAKKYEISIQQKRLWNYLVDHDITQLGVYSIKISGRVNVQVLYSAINHFVKEKEIFRQVYAELKDQNYPVTQVGEHDPLFTWQNEPFSALQRQEIASKGYLEGTALAVFLVEEDNGFLLELHLPLMSFDQTSYWLFLSALSTHYANATNGLLQDQAPIQYIDFSEWQNEVFNDEFAQGQRYWKQIIEKSDLISLPYAKGDLKSLPAYEEQTVTLPASVWMAIQDFCMQTETEMDTYFLACYKLHLDQLCALPNLPIGILANGRNVEETKALYGMLDQYLPLVCNQGLAENFIELLNQIAAEKERVFKWQFFYETGEFAADKKVAKDYLPFVFNYQSFKSFVSTGDVSFEAQDAVQHYHDFDLCLTVNNDQRNGQINLNFRFNRNQYEAVYLHFFTEQYTALVEKMMVETTADLDSISVISKSETELILERFNQPVEALGNGSLLFHQIFEEQEARTPHNIAIIDGERKFTYREVEELSNGLAQHLIGKGCKKGEIIALLTERAAHTIIGMLGILKAGCAYLPISAGYPADRIAVMLEVAKVQTVVLQEKLAHLVAADLLRIPLDGKEKVLVSSPKVNCHGLSPQDIAYVIFTSGTTGKPKACMVMHGNIVNYLLALDKTILADKAIGNFPFFTSISFDGTITALAGPWLNGKTLFVFNDSEPLDHVLTRCFNDETGIDAIKLTPSHLLILDHLPVVSSRMKLIIVGGEALTNSHVAIMKLKAPKARIFNHYGPTETTVGCLTAEILEENRSIYIGKPLLNMRAYITDTNGSLTPVGIPGEIKIGGISVAAGYFEVPELTRNSFIKDKWSEGNQYQTGDIGRWAPDGNIEYLGRKDNQVKIRGHRVEPGEVSDCINRYKKIDRAVVVTDKDKQGNNMLVVFYVVSHGFEVNREELTTFMGQSLPDYMVPALFVPVKSFPVNKNGKIDTKALLQLDYFSNDTTQVVLPSNPTQKVLAALWQDILPVTRLSVNDNFFESGGHSLLAMQLISRIREALNIEVSLRSLFTYPTIQSLQEHIDNEGIAPRKMPPFKKNTAGIPTQMSYAQKRLWFLNLLNPGNTMYNMPVKMKFSGCIDAKALQESFDFLCARHAVLRTVFGSEEDILLQIVKPYSFTGYFSTYNLSSLTGEVLEAKLEVLAAEELKHVFNLETGPLLTAKLINVDASTNYLFLNIHHIIMDEWSANIFISELAECYNAISAGRQPELKDNEFTYADFSHWQAQLIAQTGVSQIAFWKRKLDGITPFLGLPFTKKSTNPKRNRGSVIPFTLPEDLSIKVRKFSIKEQSSMFMTLYSVFALLLHKYTGALDLQVGTPVANRNYKEIENLIGFFVNTLVLRTSFNDSYTFKDLVDHVKNETIEAFAHQDIPFEQLVKELNIERERDHAPIFQTFFAVHNEGGQKLEFDGVTIQDIPILERQAKFDIVFSIDDKPRLQGYIEYNADLFDVDDMQRFCVHFEHLLKQVINKPLMPLKDISLVTDAEQHLILGEWNATQQNYPADTVAAMIKQQSLKSPQSAAIVSGTSILTYVELEEQSNCLSHNLLQQVSRTSVIAVLMDRSPQMILCFLAILKAGCEYLALDTAHPDEHINFLLEDSGAVLVIADAANKSRLSGGFGVITLDDVNLGEYRLDTHVEDAQPTDAAYVIYTSGSTGRPKGTTIHHKALQNLVQWHNTTFNITAADQCTQVASISFDASMFEIWPPLIAGATLHILNKELLLDIKALQTKVIEQKISVCFWPTPLAELMFTLDWPANIILRYVHIGGDKLRQKPDRPLPFTIIDNYGLAEACVVNISGAVSTNPEAPATIGRPIANTCVLILDRHLQLVPAGVHGEICIAGDGLALNGYNNQPQLNHERFIPNPFAAIRYPTLYRTGDTGTYTATGEIMSLDRIDRQVKIRGHRIELGEVESWLMKHPDVSDAAVICSNTSGANNSLIGFYVCPEISVSIKEELHNFLNSKLPAYMVPSALYRLPRIPVTEHYKTDFKALHQQVSVRNIAEKHTGDTGKLTPAEEKLANLWSGLLKQVTIKKNDDFFELGGHSLMVIKLRSRIAETFGIDVPVSFFFENSILATMAAGIEIRSVAAQPNVSEQVTIKKVSRDKYKI